MIRKNKDVLKIILETTNKDLAIAFECLKSDERLLLASTIHRIKGAYLMIGRSDIAELCDNIVLVLNKRGGEQYLKSLLITLKIKVNYSPHE